MILVNGNWEYVFDLQDISKIIRENYNKDLADEMDKLIPNHTDEEYEDLENEQVENEDRIRDLEMEIDDLKKEIENLEAEIEE